MGKLIFWLSFFVLFYSYVGYALSLLFLSFFVKRPVASKPFEPMVSLIIPVYNEENTIAKKLENVLGLDYPREKVEIIVSSDGSTDDTNAIVRKYKNQGIKLVVLPSRRGKAAALNEALAMSGGDIIVFTDVAIMLERNSVKRLVQNFISSEVGCVSGEDHIISSDGGEGIYGQYELALRRLESALSSTVAVSGCFYAQRRNLVVPFQAGMAPDFLSVLSVVKNGYRAISDAQAKGFMLSVSGAKDEFSRKVRTVLRGMTTLFHHKSLLNPFRHELFSFQLFSHKFIRWLAPFFMIALFIANFFLLENAFYAVFLATQVIFYGMALFVWQRGWESLGKMGRCFRFPSYLCVSNIAIIIAWLRYFMGETQEIWIPSVRTCKGEKGRLGCS